MSRPPTQDTEAFRIQSAYEAVLSGVNRWVMSVSADETFDRAAFDARFGRMVEDRWPEVQATGYIDNYNNNNNINDDNDNEDEDGKHDAMLRRFTSDPHLHLALLAMAACSLLADLLEGPYPLGLADADADSTKGPACASAGPSFRERRDAAAEAALRRFEHELREMLGRDLVARHQAAFRGGVMGPAVCFLEEARRARGVYYFAGWDNLADLELIRSFCTVLDHATWAVLPPGDVGLVDNWLHPALHVEGRSPPLVRAALFGRPVAFRIGGMPPSADVR